jgi:hypothetical protein
LFYAAFRASTGLLIPDGKAVKIPEETSMLTDAALRNLKPKSKIYKASDRDGMYVTVSTSGTITFRYDYNGRRETLTLGHYGPDGISLAMARELLLNARKAVLKGTSPALGPGIATGARVSSKRLVRQELAVQCNHRA